MTLSPLIKLGTSTWTYEGWQGQVYRRQYAKSKFSQECLGEYCQYQYRASRCSGLPTLNLRQVLV